MASMIAGLGDAAGIVIGPRVFRSRELLRPIEPISPTLSSRFLQKRIELPSPDNLVLKHDYDVDAVREVDGLAPYFECWEQHRKSDRFPDLQDFAAVRGAVELSGVHVVDTPTDKFKDFRFDSFDSTTRVDGVDFSGTLVSSYDDSSLREAARLDYSSAVATGRGCFTRLDYQRKHCHGKFARLILPISDASAGKPSKLLVVVRILELRPTDAEAAGQLRSSTGQDAVLDLAATNDLRLDDPARIAADQFNAAQKLVQAVGRDELVTQYFQNGIHEQLGDHDLLEWLLRQFLGLRRSTNLASALIDEFGSLPGVVAMGRERLPEFPDMTPQALLSLKVVRELATRLVRVETVSRPLVSDAKQVVDYCRARMAHESVEHLRILYLDQKNRLISDEVFHGGGVSSVLVSPRQIVKRAILLDAQSIIMAHNHPSGDPSPSAADVEVTRDVKRAVEALEIRLLDHMVIGRSGSLSLRTLGYLESE